MLAANIQKDIVAVGRIGAVPSILKVVAELTGMRVTMVARVTSDSWTACAAYDRMGFGLEVGTQLDVTTTLCKEVCDANKTIVIEHASNDAVYRDHPTPKLYKIESYIAIPILRPDGRMFGTLCAIDSRPAKLDPKVVTSLTLFAELVASQLRSDEQQAEMFVAQAELQKANEELEIKVQERTALLQETIAELETFSYSIAHDMRAPLRSMQGFCEVLLSEYHAALAPLAQGYLERIARASSRMDNLINDVLSYSKVARQSVEMEAVSLETVVRAVIESYPTLTAHGADITLNAALPTVRGNETRLTQVFSNLLGNAVKFVAPGVHPKIAVWSEIEGERVRVYVRDNGIGVPADQSEKIFGIFQRLSSGYEGTGIGLAIVKKAMERMEGRVGVESELGCGSTFWIELPHWTGRITG